MKWVLLLDTYSPCRLNVTVEKEHATQTGESDREAELTILFRRMREYLVERVMGAAGGLAARVALAMAVGSAAAVAQAQDLIEMRVQIYPGAYTSTTVHVADEQGFFTNNGLKVEKIPAQSSSASIAALIGGSIDVVESGADFVLANIDKGVGIKFVSANEVKNYATVIASTKLDLPNAAKGYPDMMQDFKGKRIGVNAIGSTLYLVAQMALKDAGMSDDDVEFVATGTGANTFAAWQAGSVDVQFTFAPVPELLEAIGLAKPILVLGNEGPEIVRFRGLYSGWVARDDYIASNSKAIDAFVKSIQDAHEWIRDPANRQQLIEIAQKYSPVSGMSDEENVKVLTKVIENYDQFWGSQISEEAIDLWNDYSLRTNLIKRRIPFEKVVYSGAPRCETECR